MYAYLCSAIHHIFKDIILGFANRASIKSPKIFIFALMKKNFFKQLSLLLFLFSSINLFSQDDIYNSTNKINGDSTKGFHFGLFIGSLFANQYTATMYDGYGFDIDGNKNSFDESFMKQKIIYENGGGYSNSQTDLIAEELKVDPHTWLFDETDMPTNMRYNPTFMVGITGRYSVDTKNAILLNVNVSKLIISGNFTIRTPQSQTGSSTQINNYNQTFAIRGIEQRLMLQVGYQRILGDNEKFNALVEGGLHATLAKFDQNTVQINNLNIDLTTYFNQPGLPTSLPVKKPIGIGFGAFAGLGANATMGTKTTIQLIYSPSLEKINMGVDPKLKLQNAIGLRVYYSLSQSKAVEPIEKEGTQF